MIPSAVTLTEMGVTQIVVVPSPARRTGTIITASLRELAEIRSEPYSMRAPVIEIHGYASSDVMNAKVG